MATYEDYYEKFLKNALVRQASYQAQRSAAAQQEAAQIGALYAQKAADATARYTQSANETAQAYRAVYDTNAVSELIARKQAEESLRNVSLQNSGLSRTEQTAIALTRGRADTETTRQKQAAVDRIMLELDALRGEYATTAAAKQAQAYTEASKDIAAYRRDAEETADKYAFELYKQDQKAAASGGKKIEGEGSAAGDMSNTPSYVSVLTNAKIKLVREGGGIALRYIDRMVNAQTITSEQREQIVEELNIVESEVYANEIKVITEVDRLMREEGPEAAYAYLQELHDTGAIRAGLILDLDKVYHIVPD